MNTGFSIEQLNKHSTIHFFFFFSFIAHHQQAKREKKWREKEKLLGRGSIS
jgi:hypothetical protein